MQFTTYQMAPIMMLKRPTRSPPIVPIPTAEACLAESEMELALARSIDDHLAGRLESIANDVSLPRAIRARALVNLSRSR